MISEQSWMTGKFVIILNPHTSQIAKKCQKQRGYAESFKLLYGK